VDYACGTVATDSTAVVRRAQLAERRGLAIPPGALHQDRGDGALSSRSVSRFHDRTLIVRMTSRPRSRRWPVLVFTAALAVGALLAVVVKRSASPAAEIQPTVEPLLAPAVRVEPLADDGAKAAVAAPAAETGDESPAASSQVSGFGILQIGSKPPCDIFVDDRDTGLKTPQRAIRLRPGRHRIGLENAEVGIDERFTIDISDGRTTRVIRDMSDRL